MSSETVHTVDGPSGPIPVPSGDLLIGDAWEPSASGDRRENLNPATGAPLSSVAMANPDDVGRAVDAAIDEFDAWRAWPAQRRRDVLLTLARLLDANDADLGVLRSLETGAPLKRKRGSSLAAEWTRYYAGWVDKIEGVTSAPYSSPSLSYTLPEPYGVVAVLTPWNGGIVSSAMKVAPALAAGNCVVLKPAELAPLGPLRFAELCLEAGLPPGVLNVVPGGPDAGAALVSDSRVAKVSFTGGGLTARRIMAAAAANLTPVVLELGGKSADLVFDDADLDLAAVTVIQTALANTSGQGCVLPTRLLVHHAIYDEMASRVTTMANALHVGGPFEDGVQMGPVIDEANCARILAMIDQAEQSGAGTLLTGGRRLEGALANGFFVAPTVFGDVDNESELAQREIFGPVLSMIRFTDEDDAVRIANGSEYGLGGLVFTRDLERALRLSSRLEAGYVGVNAFPPMPPNAPFGGVKQSGFGREGGREGLTEFLRTKNVYIGMPA
ncbi:MAG TPA: aldehyde dehydrogenase family protein [Ilumatobacteraceae bacterium]|nr:aldehyde dehydrogenase family protein [Ilumatobacteraceae bacterium]